MILRSIVWAFLLSAPLQAFAQQEQAVPATEETSGNDVAEANPVAEVLAPEASAPAQVDKALPYTSIMFNAEELDKINQQAEFIRQSRENAKNQPQDDLLSLLEEAPKSDKPIQYPKFYLASVIYHTPKEWAVWLLDRKFTSQSPPDPEAELTVRQVTPGKAVFEWKPTEFAAMLKRYQESTPDPALVLHEKEKMFTFSLYPNQTFAADTMQIIEGKAPATSAPISPEGALPAPSPVAPVSPAKQAPAKKSESTAAENTQGLPRERLPQVPTLKVEQEKRKP